MKLELFLVLTMLACYTYAVNRIGYHSGRDSVVAAMINNGPDVDIRPLEQPMALGLVRVPFDGRTRSFACGEVGERAVRVGPQGASVQSLYRRDKPVADVTPLLRYIPQ